MNITKHAVIVLAALTLTGCASVSGLRESSPDISLMSKRSVSDVVTCISSGWQMRRVPTRMLPIPGGQSLQADNPALAGSPFAVVDVVVAGDGSQTRYYKQGIVVSAYADVVKNCQ